MKRFLILLFFFNSLCGVERTLLLLQTIACNTTFQKITNAKTYNLGYYFIAGYGCFKYTKEKYIGKRDSAILKQYVTENPELYEYTKKIVSQLSPNNSINVIVNHPEEDLQEWATVNYGKEDFLFIPLFKTTDPASIFAIGHELAHINHKDSLTSQIISPFHSASYMICSLALLQSILAKRFYRAGLYGSLIALKFSTICRNTYSRFKERRADLTAAQLINNPTIIRAEAHNYWKYSNFEQLKNDYNNYKNHPANYLKQYHRPGYNTYLRYLQNQTHPLRIERAWYLEQFAQKLEQDKIKKNHK